MKEGHIQNPNDVVVLSSETRKKAHPVANEIWKKSMIFLAGEDCCLLSSRDSECKGLSVWTGKDGNGKRGAPEEDLYIWKIIATNNNGKQGDVVPTSELFSFSVTGGGRVIKIVFSRHAEINRYEMDKKNLKKLLNVIRNSKKIEDGEDKWQELLKYR